MKKDKPAKNQSELGEQIKKLLSEQIGVEPEDINDDDSLSEQLHMSSTDLADFVEVLSQKGLDTTSLALTEIETVDDLVEALSSEEEIE